MRIEWDERKNRAIQRKHGVSFELALEVFGDPLALSRCDRNVAGEERWYTLGIIEDVVLIVAHTYAIINNEEMIRIISARKASKHERKRYEEG